MHGEQACATRGESQRRRPRFIPDANAGASYILSFAPAADGPANAD